MIVDYSIAPTGPHRHFEAWRETVGAHLISAQAKALSEKEFQGSFKYGSFAGLDLSWQASSAHHWERTARCMKQSPDEDYWLAFMEKGIACMDHNGICRKVVDGEMIIYDGTKPFKLDLETAGFSIIRLPRALMERRAPGIERMAGNLLDPSRPGVKTLQAMLCETNTVVFGHQDDARINSFSEMLFEMLIMSINFQEAEPDQRKHDQLYRKAVAFIRRELGNPLLCLDSIANAHHVSGRTITRAFALHDQTPMGFVWAERLLSCKRALQTPSCGNVTQVAYDHGFTSMSHFSRAFRKAFGCPPSSLH